MRIIPAIFIQNGKLVSLYKGNENAEKKIYAKSPKTYVEFFAKEGAKTMFIVDLDGDQEARLPEFRELFTGELWWAGQVRDTEKIQRLLTNGADRIVLGQSASEIYQDAIAKFGKEKLLAGLMLKHYEDAPELCDQLGSTGFDEILVKDLNAEGTLFQPNFDLMEKCVYFSKKTIYASGGIATKNHIKLLKRAGVSGIIIARALYEGDLKMSELLQEFQADLQQ
ncbi:hypothetical protein HOH67_03875 [Candidatus Peregrinibacteria bacterium]|mgnify:FL=1|jgi:phosphoribosylformimino-5-aminoimidazole carboxamide ribotide isomerase|nr:hypothetical protein [Candidatus Peregrinibacteria bacterium]MBT5824236.1 hypothetical protein [Candidatus Peregrinibacteria bacterium]